MARVFISALGTNKYVPCYYTIDGQRSVQPVVFVQEALVAHFCRDWNPRDRVLIFCTEKAREINWQDGGNFDRGLKTRLEALTVPASLQRVAIPEGQNEKEIMDIFMILVDALQSEDRVFLDITHSFRSLPLLQTVILNYAKVLKNVRVERILYGAFETLGSIKDVEKMPEEKRIAPVFDLTPYDVLLDWARAVDIFQKAGRPQEIKRLVTQDLRPILSDKEKRQTHPDATALNDLAQSIETLCLDLAAVRGPKIAETKSFGDQISEVEDQQYIAPLKPLFELLREKLRPFETPDPEAKSFDAAAWCLEHELIPQAYIIARETVLTGLCRCWGHDPLDEQTREAFWSALLHVLATKKPEGEWEGLLAAKLDEARRIVEHGGEALKRLASAFEKIRDRRNDLLHGGWRKNAASAKSLVDFFYKGGLEDLRDAWEAYRATIPSPPEKRRSNGEPWS